MGSSNIITVAIDVKISVEKAWALWNNPADIMQWNNTDENWHNLKVFNDLQPGGKFLFAMAKKDGSENFDFEGIYDEVKYHKLITYTLDDGRKTTLTFEGTNPVIITETFDPEPHLPIDMQKEFCQAVLDNFKKHAENSI